MAICPEKEIKQEARDVLESTETGGVGRVKWGLPYCLQDMQGGPSEEMTFALRPEKGGVRQAEIKRKGIPGGAYSTRKSPEVEKSLACVRNMGEDAAAGAVCA